MSASARFLLVAGSALAASFVFARFIEAPTILEIVWKTGGILLLAGAAFRSGAQLAGAALVFSAVGDVLLELRPPLLVGGMAAFAAAHCFYISAFVAIIRRRSIHRWTAISTALVAAASLSLLLYFLRDMGALAAPGVLYHLIITAMAALAVASRAPLAAKAGALLFLLSDALIAFGLYKQIQSPPGSVWITYAAAQILLTHAFIRMQKLQ